MNSNDMNIANIKQESIDIKHEYLSSYEEDSSCGFREEAKGCNSNSFELVSDGIVSTSIENIKEEEVEDEPEYIEDSEVVNDDEVQQNQCDICRQHTLTSDHLIAHRSALNMRRRTSEIWAYFEDVGAKSAQCNYCSKVLSFKSGSLQNLSRHLKTVHAALMRGKSIGKPTNGTTITPTDTDMVDIDVDTKSEEDDMTLVQSTSRDAAISNDSPSTSSCQQQQPFITSFFKESISDSSNQELQFSLVKMLVKNYLPFDLLDSIHFKTFLAKLNPSYTLPTKEVVSTTLVPLMCNIIKDKVKSNMQSSQSFCLTTDSWTSTANESYLAVTVHFEDDFKLRSHLLECINITNKQTAQDLCEVLNKVATEWNIQNKISAVVTDNAANLKAAVNLCDYKHVSCFAHNLNLIIQSSIGEISDIKNKVEAIVEFFKQSPEAADKLNLKQVELNVPILNVKQDVATRWISTYDMLHRILEIHEPLISIITLEYPQIPNLLINDVKIIKQCCLVLEFFKSTAEEMCSEQFVAISKVILIINGLKKRCVSFLESDLELPARKLTEKLLNQLAGRFSNFEDNSIYTHATLLDPRFKQYGFSFENKDIFEKTKKELETELGLTSERQSIQEYDGIKYCQSIWDDFDFTVSNLVDKENSYSSIAIAELEMYLKEPLLMRQGDPFNWWKKRTHIYNTLCPIAMKKLTIMSTSVPSERVFSKAGQILTDTRSRLSGKRVSQLVFLNFNA